MKRICLFILLLCSMVEMQSQDLCFPIKAQVLYEVKGRSEHVTSIINALSPHTIGYFVPNNPIFTDTLDIAEQCTMEKTPNNITIYKGIINDRILFVNESKGISSSAPLTIINWELVADGDTVIAGSPCKLAVGSYKGKTFRAWYSTEITLPFGPDVFHGLPGLILKIKAINSEFSIVAKEIRKDVEGAIVINPSSYRRVSLKKLNQIIRNLYNQSNPLILYEK